MAVEATVLVSRCAAGNLTQAMNILPQPQCALFPNAPFNGTLLLINPRIISQVKQNVWGVGRMFVVRAQLRGKITTCRLRRRIIKDLDGPLRIIADLGFCCSGFFYMI